VEAEQKVVDEKAPASNDDTTNEEIDSDNK